MSAPERRLVVTARARADLQGILRYTTQQWGKRQRGIYKAKLTAAMNQLTRHPHMGEARDDIPAGMRAKAVEQHVIFYRADDEAITVIRILHRKMDAPTHLGP
jgi:toxin ParE1/3/4